MSTPDKTPGMPQLLNVETIQAVAENAELLRGMLSSGDEQTALKDSGGCCPTCCCPKFVKFKFILCNVWIYNENAACIDGVAD
ncbi:hypothetical protein [Candidatus Formimonas warabiya]|uniref:Uncharacterized protein n=1 Tax=Formimonas warabiya TaxID=1761012 RepID=A0A3G1KPM2_FORW1|nr:hypothetical protein [Candidatus Formimonas warabiya]ATW24388.1 hypothetical protein DCMF_05950 [Candidatus Formimonas warabiya]